MRANKGSAKYNDITFIFTWYGQYNHLFAHLNKFKERSEKYKIPLNVICINDGHPESFFTDAISQYDEHFNLTGIQITKDFGFNSHGCRNLGVQYAKTDWVLLHDADCHFSDELFEDIMTKELDQNKFYPFLVSLENNEQTDEEAGYEIVDPKKLYKVRCHPNTHLMTRKCFWSTGGYDQEFQRVRHGDSEFFLGIGRPEDNYDHELLSENVMNVTTPLRRADYIFQDPEVRHNFKQTVKHVRDRNEDPYRKYRKMLYNFEWEIVNGKPKLINSK